MGDPFPLVLPEDDKEAEWVFNNLSLRDQMDLVLRNRGKARLRMLRLSTHPQDLVEKLPPFELYLTVKEIGDKDAHDLIVLTTAEQLQYILDLDLWKRAELDPERILHWLEMLFECGEEKVMEFIQSTDSDTLLLLLKKLLCVTRQEGEEAETSDRLPPFTLDNFYLITFRRPEGRSLLQHFLKYLYHASGERYIRLMEALIMEMESDLEEMGYCFRNGRLSDAGFPTLEESLEIYRFVNPRTIRDPEDLLLPGQKETPEKARSTFFLTFQQEGPFFASVLSRVTDPTEQDRLKEELTSLCNKAMVAEWIDLSNLEEVGRITQQVFHTLNLGLEFLSDRDPIRALRFIRSLPLQKIFQCGVGVTILLRKKAETLLQGSWFGGDRGNLILLDPPHSDLFEGLLRKKPVLFRKGIPGDLTSLQDLFEAESFLERMNTVTGHVEKAWKVYPSDLKQSDLGRCFPKEWRELTLSILFLTAWANQILEGRYEFKPVRRDHLKDLLAHVSERDEQGKGVIKMEIRDGLRGWVKANEGDESKERHLLAFWDFCLDLFEGEFGKIPAEQMVDPRFVKGLLICE